jgi:hypothetical protein
MKYEYLHKPSRIWNIFLTIIFLVYIYIVATWGTKGENPNQIFFPPKNSFFLATDMRKGKYKNWVTVEESGVCTLRTGSNQSPSTFYLNSS